MAGFEVPADTAGQPERFRTGTFIMPAFRLTEEQAETPEEGGIDAMFDNCAASDLLRSEPRRPEFSPWPIRARPEDSTDIVLQPGPRAAISPQGAWRLRCQFQLTVPWQPMPGFQGQFRVWVSDHPDACARHALRMCALQLTDPWQQLAVALALEGAGGDQLVAQPALTQPVAELRQIMTQAGAYERLNRAGEDFAFRLIPYWRQVALRDLGFRRQADFELASDALLELCRESRNGRETGLAAAVVCLDPQVSPARLAAASEAVDSALRHLEIDFVQAVVSIDQAQILYRSGRFRDALAALRRAENGERIRLMTAECSCRLRIQTLRALCWQSLGDRTQALKAAQQVTQHIRTDLFPSDARDAIDHVADNNFVLWLTLREAEQVLGIPLMPRASPDGKSSQCIQPK